VCIGTHIHVHMCTSNKNGVVGLFCQTCCGGAMRVYVRVLIKSSFALVQCKASSLCRRCIEQCIRLQTWEGRAPSGPAVLQ
jgi:hypothetical protein